MCAILRMPQAIFYSPRDVDSIQKMVYQGKVTDDDIPDSECFDDLFLDLRKVVDALAIEIKVHQLGDDKPLLGILRTAASVQYRS